MGNSAHVGIHLLYYASENKSKYFISCSHVFSQLSKVSLFVFGLQLSQKYLMIIMNEFFSFSWSPSLANTHRETQQGTRH